jgi:hypothetical protein
MPGILSFRTNSDRKKIITTISTLIAALLFLKSFTTPSWWVAPTEFEIVRGIYYATAAVVFILGLLPWASD